MPTEKPIPLAAFMNSLLSKFLLGTTGFVHFEDPSVRKFSCQVFWGALYT